MFGSDNTHVYIIIVIIVSFGMMEWWSGYLRRTRRTKNDWMAEIGSFFILTLLTGPAVILSANLLGNVLIPQLKSSWIEMSLWILLPFYLLVEDFLHYWYHRFCHEYDFMWKFHRTHHQVKEMGFLVSFRNAVMYYVLLPDTWWVGFFIFMGGGEAVAISLVIKQLVIVGSHSTVHWDAIFYKNKILTPFITVLERIVVTPAFHHSHHGKSMLDGISDPNGNFGNVLSIWDQVFGTAKFTRGFSTDLGLMNDPKESWETAILYPLFKSKDPNSEMSKGFKKEKTANARTDFNCFRKGAKISLVSMRKKSKPAFCDGTHHGSKFKPLLFEAKRTGEFSLCNCKMTKTGPFVIIRIWRLNECH